MAKRKYERFHKYQCSISEEEFTVTAEAPNPDDLVSVEAYYEMNPEEDDRPEHIKKLKKSETDFIES